MCDILAVPDERYLLPPRVVGYFLKGLSSHKIMVEFDETPVAEVVGSQVVVGDILGVKATPERSHTFIAICGQPLSVSLQLFTDVDRRTGRWYPPRFQGIGSVSSRAHLPKPVILTGFNNGVPDFVAFFPRTEQF